jgi:8-oxo-dGTP diphosphatase
MGRSPFFAGWKSCPRCRADLAVAGAKAACGACGLEVYANPAPTASALVEDGEGRVLLARRARDPGAGLWDLLGGFMDEGEEPLETLRRELREETGLGAEPGDFVGGLADRYGPEGIWTMNLYWTARLEPGEPRPADDVAELSWFRRDELPPRSDFAFGNTYEALARWRRSS